MSSFTISTEMRPDRQLAVTIQVAQEDVERELRKAANKVASQYRIPGFRKGKAPYHIIVQQFGLANLYGEFVDDLGQKLFAQAIELEGIKPYAQSSLEDIKLEPLTYVLTVPMEPEVKLGDYRSLRMEQPAPEVDESAVDDRLNQLLEEYASWGPVTRPSEYGDLMTIDVRSVIPAAEGEAEIVVLDETGWDVTPDEENPMEPPGFDQELLGLVAGETKLFSLTWPEDSQSIYAGKTANFTVSVNEVEAYARPALDDDFAQLVGPDFATLDDLKASIRSSLAADKANSVRGQFITSVLDAIVAISELNYPPVVIEDQIDGMVQDMDQQLRRYGLEGIEALLRRQGQTMEQYRASLAEPAKSIALRNLVLSELVKSEQLTVSEEELAERATRVARQDYQEPEAAEDESDEAADEATGEADAGEDHSDEIQQLVEFFTTGGGRTMLMSQILTEKAVDRVVAIVSGAEVPAPAAGSESDAAAAA